MYMDNPFVVKGIALDSGTYGRWFYVNLIDDETFELKIDKEFKIYKFGETIKNPIFDIKIFKNDLASGKSLKDVQYSRIFGRLL